MRPIRYTVVFVFVVSMLVILLGWGISANEVVPEIPKSFEDNFTDSEVGKSPAGWTVSSGPEFISVVADPDIESGRAVQMKADLNKTSTSMSVPIGDPFLKNAVTVEVEHKIKFVRGKNNLYVSLGGADHILHWWVEDSGVLAVRSGSRSMQLGESVKEGWNHIKLVANRETNKFSIYLNDMDIPVREDLDFRQPTESWHETRVIFSMTHSNGEEKEMYIGEVKVRAVDDPPPSAPPAAPASPVPLEYPDVIGQNRESWKSDEAKRLADRIARSVRAAEVTIGIPLAQLSVPDGILPTQLALLAHVYAVRGERSYKDAFNVGLAALLRAQFPSGGWPTIFPRYQRWDLHGDMYAGSTWNEIPALFNAIVSETYPFDGDLISVNDRLAVKQALERIPAKSDITRFAYSNYTGRSAQWWASEEAVRIADNLLTWQVPAGGWWEDIAMHYLPYDPVLMTRSRSTVGSVERATFDDGGTIDPIRFLARVYEATEIERFKEAVYRGLDFVMDAQYETGGWPQSYPQPSGYGAYATFNDQAMINVLKLIQDILEGNPPFGFVEETYRNRLQAALDKGVEYILKAQIVDRGRLTAWGQQHDPFTYEPRSARSFEPIGITAGESVPIIEFLMTFPDPSEDIKRAILSALEWLEDSRLPDGRWARFYEIGSGRPIFAGRDGIVRYNVTEIELERQLNYGWYGTWANTLLSRLRSRGYIDELYESLPDHPSVRLRFGSLRDGQRVSGTIPVDLTLLHPHKEAGLESVVISLGDDRVYQARTLPRAGELLLDTRQWADGKHTLTVSVIHGKFGTFHQSVDIEVRNRWTLVQNMSPPVTQGWFGGIDFLQTAHRSEGWGYETGNAQQFFGDSQRLVRLTDSSEYLVWNTPKLQKVDLIAFVDVGFRAEDGLELAVSTDGKSWHIIGYESQYETQGESKWRQLKINLSFDSSEADDWNWFRIIFADTLPRDAVQIGHIDFEGYESQ